MNLLMSEKVVYDEQVMYVNPTDDFFWILSQSPEFYRHNLMRKVDVYISSHSNPSIQLQIFKSSSLNDISNNTFRDSKNRKNIILYSFIPGHSLSYFHN